jgi:hypothetical protein
MPTNIDDELWMNVANALGDGWFWTRDERASQFTSGWLQADLRRLYVTRDNDVWVICDALDLRIPELKARVRPIDLYSQGTKVPAGGIGIAYGRDPSTIACCIREFMLPALEQTLRRFEAYRRQRLEQHAARRAAVESLQRVCPSAALSWDDPREVPILYVGNVAIGVFGANDYAGLFDRSVAEYALRTACSK